MIWLIARRDSESAERARNELLKHAQKRGIAVEPLRDDVTPEPTDTLIVLGGDGTLIRSARTYGHLGVPVVAINLGRLGYVTSFSAEMVCDALDALVAGTLIEDRRMRLSVRWGDQHERSALNEALVTSGQPGRICDVALRIDDQPATQLRGDGALVATPTGSTAYALSAGGPILMPGMTAMVIVPVAPHSIRFRPLVVPLESKLTITPEDAAWLVLDGQERLPLEAGTTVHLSGDAPALRLLRPADHNHLKTLRSKLHWGEWS